MGYHNLADGVCKSIGKSLSAEYMKKYGERPSKHKQTVEGAVRPVNSYTERDRDLVENAIRVHMCACARRVKLQSNLRGRASPEMKMNGDGNTNRVSRSAHSRSGKPAIVGSPRHYS